MEMEMPNGVQTHLQANAVVLKGPQGELRRSFPSGISMQLKGSVLLLESADKALLNTYAAHLANMVRGVQNGYQVKLKVVYAHFPITVEAKGERITIKNFLGEKQVRMARLFSPTKLDAKGAEVVLKGPDKEALGLTLASMRQATRIKKKDSRVFQDGFYVLERT